MPQIPTNNNLNKNDTIRLREQGAESLSTCMARSSIGLKHHPNKNFLSICGVAGLSLIAVGCAKSRDLSTQNATTSPTQCSLCHGSASNPAPPRDTNGNTSTTVLSVGAHQSHVQASKFKGPLDCGQCHEMPAADDVWHAIRKSPSAKVRFGSLAAAGGVSPFWDPSSARCVTYCHGETLPGGTVTEPFWIQVDGSQVQCGSCHGTPPADLNHANVTTGTCDRCHPDTVLPNGTIDITKSKHIDGTVQVTCTNCHGNSARSGDLGKAPPNDSHGNTDRVFEGVGAHQAHLSAAAALSSPISCNECHPVPGPGPSPASAVHFNGTVDIVFGTLARGNGTVGAKLNRPIGQPTKPTCAVYCHGAGLKTATGGSPAEPTWNSTDVLGIYDGEKFTTCGSCHGLPPLTGRHKLHMTYYSIGCQECHGSIAPNQYGQLQIINPKIHIDGKADARLPNGQAYDSISGCTLSCHGYTHDHKRWN